MTTRFIPLTTPVRLQSDDVDFNVNGNLYIFPTADDDILTFWADVFIKQFYLNNLAKLDDYDRLFIEINVSTDIDFLSTSAIISKEIFGVDNIDYFSGIHFMRDFYYDCCDCFG